MDGKALGTWLVAGVLFLAVGTAQASYSPVVFRIEVSNALGSDSFEVSSADLVPDTVGKKWILPMGEELSSGGGSNVIANLLSATLRVHDANTLQSGPFVIMNFQLRAGELNTTVHVQSALVSFAAIPAAEAEAKATAGYSLTDWNDGIPATLQSLNPTSGQGMYTARYNPTVQNPMNGVVFANLVNEVSIDAGGSGSVSDAQPPMGWAPVGAAVSAIGATHDFTLTARDLMTGQSTFAVKPEPGALAGLLLAVAGLARRR